MNERRIPALVWVASLALLVEGLIVAGGGILLIAGLLAPTRSSGPDAVALIVIAALAVLGCVLMIAGLLRGRFWVRAAIVVWQLLQLAVGVSALTGRGAQPLLGWPLIGLAVILIVLLFTPSVLAATARRERG